MGFSKKYSDETISLVITRLNSGAGAVETSDAFKIPRRTIRSWHKAYKSGRIVITKHVHHWDLETPNGPTARGVCRGCLEQKDFYNSLTTKNWVTAKERELYDDTFKRRVPKGK